ncbi:MAG: hypothetical protein OQL19_02890 [Gammaproteobacteria bacterium]|nr:hypothetical protein [Gammaproteobacteria bacterium]
MNMNKIIYFVVALGLSTNTLASLDNPFGFTDQNGQYWQFSCYTSGGEYIAAGYNNGCNGEDPTDTGNTNTDNTDTGNTDTGNTDTGNSDTGNSDTGNTDTGNTDTGNTDTDDDSSISSNPIMQMFESFFGGPLNSITEAMVSVMEPMVEAMLDMSDEVLTMADEILKMADRIGDMADKILEMADRIGEMADKIVQVQHSMSNLVANLFGSGDSTTFVGVSMVKPMANDNLTSSEVPVIELSNKAENYVLVASSSSLFSEGNTISTMVTDEQTLAEAWKQSYSLVKDGKLYLSIRAIDGDGNLSGVSNSAKVNVTIDTPIN